MFTIKKKELEKHFKKNLPLIVHRRPYSVEKTLKLKREYFLEPITKGRKETLVEKDGVTVLRGSLWLQKVTTWTEDRIDVNNDLYEIGYVVTGSTNIELKGRKKR